MIITEFLDLLWLICSMMFIATSPLAPSPPSRPGWVSVREQTSIFTIRGRKDVPAGGLAKCRRWQQLRGAGRGGDPRRRPFTPTARPHTNAAPDEFDTLRAAVADGANTPFRSPSPICKAA